MRVLSELRSMLFVSLVMAITACAQSSYAEELYPFGRLFTSPAERKALDTIRIRGPEEKIDDTVTQVETSQPPPIDAVTYSGFLRRADGKYMLWVNRTSDLSAGTRLTDTTIKFDRQNSAVFHSGNERRILKPGDTWRIPADEIDAVYVKRPGAEIISKDPETP